MGETYLAENTGLERRETIRMIPETPRNNAVRPARLVRFVRFLCRSYTVMLFLLAPSAFAQNFQVHTYTEDDGLPSSTVYDIILDPARKMCYPQIVHLISESSGDLWRFKMSKNVTIRLDEAIIKKCRHAAVEEDKSLSQWVADALVKVVSAQDVKQTARARALKRLEEGFSLEGTPLTREEIYAG